MLTKLVEYLMGWCERRGRVLKITGTAGPDDVYLIRYYLVKSRYLNVFIHQFLRSDRDDLHDHPWHFFTYLVRGSYTEKKWNDKSRKVEETRRVNENYYMDVERTKKYKMNCLVFRKATDQHQVLVDKDLKPHEKDKAALTICVTGPTIREWGFVREYEGMFGFKNRTWVPWREYLGLPPDAPGRG